MELEEEEAGRWEAGLVMVRGGAILAIPDAPVRVLGSGRRGGGREPTAESGEATLTLEAPEVGEEEEVPVNRMDPMVSVAAIRRV